MWNIYKLCVSWMVKVLLGIAAVGVFVMMGVTVFDVIFRRFGMPVPGAVDLVQVAACLSAACSLPYTTAVKGHVAVEYFFQKLPRCGKVIVDSIWRIAVIILYAVMSWRSVVYGITLLKRHSMTLTLQIPLFWILWLLAFSFGVVSLVKIYNLTHPGREMMKP